MADKTDSKSRPRAPLSREQVLQAAITVADEVGLQALTMRRLGKQLGFEAMSLYKHVANKDDLLDGIADIVIGQIEVPLIDGDWRAGMRQRAASARKVLVSHPWALGILENRGVMGPGALRYMEAVIGSLRAGGFSVEMAAHAFLLLDSYIYGFVVQELSMPIGTASEAAAEAESVLAEIPTDEYPHLTEMAFQHARGPGFDYVHEFEFGLELILDGLEDLRGSSSQIVPPT